jgi:hypothetical protein
MKYTITDLKVNEINITGTLSSYELPGASRKRDIKGEDKGCSIDSLAFKYLQIENINHQLFWRPIQLLEIIFKVFFQ